MGGLEKIKSGMYLSYKNIQWPPFNSLELVIYQSRKGRVEEYSILNSDVVNGGFSKSCGGSLEKEIWQALYMSKCAVAPL